MKGLLVLVSFLIFIVAIKAQLLTTTPVFYYSNSYIVDDGINAIIIDTGINITHVTRLLNALATVANGNITVDAIFITHGHPDHYSGLAYLPSAFNVVPVWVANQRVKDELLENLRLNSASLPVNVTTYPYASRVQPLPNQNLQGLIRNLTVLTNFKPAETAAFGLVYDAVQQVVWSGDLLYKNVHAYLGPTVNPSRVQRWIDDISLLIASFPAGNAVLWPGHGGSGYTNVAEIAQFQFYLRRFLGLVNACVPPANLGAQLVHLFPRMNTTAFVLNFIATNPAWANYQSVACDTTNSTRITLCDNLRNRQACNDARPLCLWRKLPTTAGGSKRHPQRRPGGSCLASLRAPRPSQPFGF